MLYCINACINMQCTCKIIHRNDKHWIQSNSSEEEGERIGMGVESTGSFSYISNVYFFK